MDEQAFAQFYEKTRHGLRRYIAGMMNGHPHADDIFQESYVRFIQRGTPPENEPQRKSYLYRIATNLITDFWRRKKREVAWSLPAERISPASQPGDEDLRQDVSTALGNLTPRQRSIVWLAYAEDYTHREIATILNLRESSVKVVLFRARQKLLEVLRSLGIKQGADV